MFNMIDGNLCMRVIILFAWLFVVIVCCYCLLLLFVVIGCSSVVLSLFPKAKLRGMPLRK